MELAWTAHPVLRQRRRGSLVGLLIVAAGVFLGIWMGSAVWGVFAAGILFLSLEAFFLPTRYALTSEGVGIRRGFSDGRHAWSDYRRVYADHNGLTLSPYRRRTLLEPYRSARLLFDGGDPDQIRATVRRLCAGAEWIDAPAGSRGAGR